MNQLFPVAGTNAEISTDDRQAAWEWLRKPKLSVCDQFPLLRISGTQNLKDSVKTLVSVPKHWQRKLQIMEPVR